MAVLGWTYPGTDEVFLEWPVWDQQPPCSLHLILIMWLDKWFLIYLKSCQLILAMDFVYDNIYLSFPTLTFPFIGTSKYDLDRGKCLRSGLFIQTLIASSPWIESPPVVLETPTGLPSSKSWWILRLSLELRCVSLG